MKTEMTNRQKAALETRRRLVVAARKVMYGRDFEDVSVAEITREAGTSVGSFYVYFKSKEDIVEELRQHDFYRLAEIANGMEGRGILERLEYYCREFMRGIEECGLEVTRQWIRNNVAPMRMHHTKEEITKYAFDDRAVRSVLRTAVECGLLKADAPVDELALFINSQLYGLMTVWCMSDGAVVGSNETDRFCKLFLESVLKPYLK